VTKSLVIVGAGGFGRETIDIVEAVNATAADPAYEVLGVLDDGPSDVKLKRLADRGVPYLGTVEAWLAQGTHASFALAVGLPSARRRLSERFETAGLQAETLIHPDAVVGSVSSIGPGTIICGGVHVSTNVHLDRHVHLNPNATIGHDATISEFVSINPAATVSGECQVGARVLIGAGAVVLQGLTVGCDSVVGAAACVVRDVPPRTTVKGVPAR